MPTSAPKKAPLHRRHLDRDPGRQGNVYKSARRADPQVREDALCALTFAASKHGGGLETPATAQWFREVAGALGYLSLGSELVATEVLPLKPH